jgi:beta-phosphoglucomutase-like phosphatase (HAD superfamily)
MLVEYIKISQIPLSINIRQYICVSLNSNMELNTVIFDIDGLLVDSEPLWNEAAAEVFKQYGVNLTEEQYKTTTGLRTKEFVQWWFAYYNIGNEELARAEKKIVHSVLEQDRTQRKDHARCSLYF